MPELPELDAAAGLLTDLVGSRTVDGAEIGTLNLLRTATPPIEALLGRPVASVGRRGKYLLVDCSGVTLVVHLARAGWLRWSRAAPARRIGPGRGPVALRLRFTEGGSLDVTEAGTRKSVAAWLTSDPGSLPELATLGPDAITVSRDDLARLVAGTAAHVKTILTDQRVLAGIGNGWSDEILHTARLSPYAPGRGLSPEQVDALYEAIGATMTRAREGLTGVGLTKLKDAKKSLLRVHGRTGLPCPVCGTDIAEVAFAERSLQYCPGCQTGGRRLSDRRMDRLLK